MTYETLQNIYMAAGIASLVTALLAVALFFLLGIPDVIGFLTGKSRRKGIDEIREQSGSGGRQRASANALKAKKKKKAAIQTPAQMGRTEAPVQAQMADAAGTTPLDQASTTTVLEGAENLTTVLPDSDAMATTVLEQNIPAAPMPEFTAQPFEIEFEITYIHTNEVIG